MNVETSSRVVKVSAPLPERQYFELVDFCAAAARDVQGRVTHTDVVRALVAELSSDHLLRRRVIDRVIAAGK